LGHYCKIIQSDKSPDSPWGKVRVRWGGDWEKRKEEMLEEFCSAIYDSQVICVGATVDCQAFKTANIPNVRKKNWDDPHYLAFQWAVVMCLHRVDWGEADGTIGLILDDDYEKSSRCYALYHKLKGQLPEAKRKNNGHMSL
jgi:hypothetical protein